MTKFEKKLAVILLREAASEFSNHGCNDFTLPNTPENLQFANSVEKWSCGEENNDSKSEKIYLNDYTVMNYLANLLEKEIQNENS